MVFERVFYDASENQSVLFLPRNENRNFSTHGKKNQLTSSARASVRSLRKTTGTISPRALLSSSSHESSIFCSSSSRARQTSRLGSFSLTRFARGRGERHLGILSLSLSLSLSTESIERTNERTRKRERKRVLSLTSSSLASRIFLLSSSDPETKKHLLFFFFLSTHRFKGLSRGGGRCRR